jgi:hypothetical protein
MKTIALALLLTWSSMGSAQVAAPPPPPLPAASETKAAKPAPTNTTSAKPRRSIELSPAERQAIDERESKAVKPASVEEALQPKPAGDPDNVKVERDDSSNTTRIEQFRTSNRISEVVVTPAGSSRSYSMTNNEGRQPLGTTQMSPGLSVPNFFRFEFGRAAPAPLQAPAPPQTAPAK